MLRSADNHALNYTVGGVGTVTSRVVRGGEAVGVGSLLGHSVGGARRQPRDHDALASLDGHCSVIGNRTVRHRIHTAAVHFVRKVAVKRLITVEVHLEGKVLLVLLGLVGRVAPIDVLGDHKVAGQLERHLAVVAQVLSDVIAKPFGMKHVLRRLGIVGILNRRQRVGAVEALRTRRNVRIVTSVVANKRQVGTAYVDPNMLGLLRGSTVFTLLPIGVLVVQGPPVVDDVVTICRLGAVLIEVKLLVLGVVIEAVAVARREGGSGGAVRAAVVSVGVEVERLPVIRCVSLNDFAVQFRVAHRIIKHCLNISLDAYAVEQANGICLAHRHDVVVGVDVVVAHRDERRRNCHRHLVAHGGVVVMGHHNEEVSEIRLVVNLVTFDRSTEVIGVDGRVVGRVPCLPARIARDELVSVGKLHLVRASTRTGDFHVRTKLVGEDEVAWGVSTAGRHLFDGRAGTDIRGRLVENLVEDGGKLAGIARCLVVVRIALSSIPEIVPCTRVRIVARNRVHEDVCLPCLTGILARFSLARISTVEDTDGVDHAATVFDCVGIVNSCVCNALGEVALSSRNAVSKEDDNLVRIETVGSVQYVVCVTHTRTSVGRTVPAQVVYRLLKRVDIVAFANRQPVLGCRTVFKYDDRDTNLIFLVLNRAVQRGSLINEAVDGVLQRLGTCDGPTLLISIEGGSFGGNLLAVQLPTNMLVVTATNQEGRTINPVGHLGDALIISVHESVILSTRGILDGSRTAKDSLLKMTGRFHNLIRRDLDVAPLHGHVLIHRTGVIQHEHDVERLSGGNCLTHVRRGGKRRQAHKEVGASLPHGIRNLAAERVILAKHALVGPDANHALRGSHASGRGVVRPLVRGVGIDLYSISILNRIRFRTIANPEKASDCTKRIKSRRITVIRISCSWCSQ